MVKPMRLYENNTGVVIRRKNSASAPRSAYPDFLMHYGIKGQQWGIRRFQNEDGSLTEEGKARYNDNRPESETWKKSDAEHLSDEELRRRNNRLQQERQYKDLTTSQVERERAQRRKDIINKVLIGTAVSLAAVAMRGHYKKAASFIGQHGKTLLTKIRGALTRPRTARALANSPHPLKNLGDQYAHVNGSARNYRAGKYSKMFNYRPKNVKGGLPPRFGLPTKYWPTGNVRRKIVNG